MCEQRPQLREHFADNVRIRNLMIRTLVAAARHSTGTGLGKLNTMNDTGVALSSQDELEF